MNSSVRFLIGLFVSCVVIVTGFWILHRRDSAAMKAVQRETAGFKSHLENLGTELASIREQINQLQSTHSSGTLNHSSLPSAAQAEILSRTLQLEATQSNVLASIQALSDAINPNLSPHTTLISRQQAFAELKRQVLIQDQKSTMARSNLQDWSISLRVPNDIAALEASAALKDSGLVNYWPYFGAKREFEDAVDLARLLKRKIQIEELELAVETARIEGAR